MNKTKTIITAASLSVLGVVIFAGAVAALNFDFSKLSTWKYETNTYEADGGFDNISIDEDISDIVFECSGDESCKVVCYEAEKMKHSVTVENGTLTIGVKDYTKWYDYIGISFTSPKMTVYLPENEYASLFINVDTGDIDIPQSFTFDELEIKSDTGDVDCMADVSSAIKIESDTGDVSVSSVDSVCNIDIKTDTGSIRLTDAACTNLNAKCDTGNVFLVNVVAAENIFAESDTGNITLKNSDAAELSLKTDTGSITGTLLSEKVFIAKSSVGNVSVPESTSGGKCEIKTDTGNIRIDVN